MKPDYQDKIDDYLLHRMSDKELSDFKKKLCSDRELKEQYEFTKDLGNVLKGRNDKLSMMQKWKDDYSWKKKVAISGSHVLYWASSVAAVFIVGLLVLRNYYLPEKSIDNNSIRTDELLFNTGGNSDVVIMLNQEKYEDAYKLIQEKSQSLKMDSIMLSRSQDIDEYQRDSIMRILNEKQVELNWFKTHLFPDNNQQKAVLEFLDELRNNDGVYKRRADSLYNLFK